MNKLEIYFTTLILCIIIFAFLQTISIIATIIIQIFSVFILLYGLFGIILFTKNKKGDKNGNSKS